MAGDVITVVRLSVHHGVWLQKGVSDDRLTLFPLLPPSGGTTTPLLAAQALVLLRVNQLHEAGPSKALGARDGQTERPQCHRRREELGDAAASAVDGRRGRGQGVGGGGGGPEGLDQGPTRPGHRHRHSEGQGRDGGEADGSVHLLIYRYDNSKRRF